MCRHGLSVAHHQIYPHAIHTSALPYHIARAPNHARLVVGRAAPSLQTKRRTSHILRQRLQHLHFSAQNHRWTPLKHILGFLSPHTKKTVHDLKRILRKSHRSRMLRQKQVACKRHPRVLASCFSFWPLTPFPFFFIS